MSLEKVCEVDALEAGQALRAEITDERVKGFQSPLCVTRKAAGTR